MPVLRQAGWVLVGSNLAFKGQPLLIMKEKKKWQTPVQFWLLNQLLRKPRVLPLPCRLVQAHEDCRWFFPLASQKQRVQVLPFSPAWYRRSSKALGKRRLMLNASTRTVCSASAVCWGWWRTQHTVPNLQLHSKMQLAGRWLNYQHQVIRLHMCPSQGQGMGEEEGVTFARLPIVCCKVLQCKSYRDCNLEAWE